MRVPRELTQFKKGWEGGPGRPKGKPTLRGLFVEAIERDSCLGRPNPDGWSNARVLIEAAIYHARMGNFSYFNEIACAIDGKIPDAEPKPETSMEEAVAYVKKKAARSKGKKQK